MASSSKTAFLRLNNWAASDKPKRDDFNNDNRLIDAGVQTVSQGLAALEGAQGGFASKSSLNSHTGNAGIHCTAEEKALLGKHDFVFGTYNGDSAATRKIPLGYAPKFVLVFPVDTGLFEAMFSTGALYVYSAAGIPSNAARGLRLESDGFTVVFSASVNAGVSVRTNQSGITYGYMVVK